MALGAKIKGITIEFDGDTTKLGQALKKVDAEARNIDKSLNGVNRALKFNPKNTELITQKQELFKQKIAETEKRLNALKATQEKLDADNVDKNSQEYMELRREIIETESKLKHFEAEAEKLNRIRFTQLGESFQQVGNKMKGVGQSMSMYVTAPIVAGYTLAAKSASDYEENLNKIDVAFGKNAESVKKWARTATEQFGLSQVAATGAASAFGALAKGVGLTDDEAADVSTSLAGLSADLASYFNTGTDESAKALEGIFTGESEALKRFGVVMTDTNLKQFAKEQGLVWEEMSQTEKTMLRYSYVMDKTKDAQGDYARTSDGTANSIKTFKATIENLATAIGQNLLPIITPIIQKITDWIKKFGELSPQTQKIITIIGMIAAAAGPLLIVLGQMTSGIGAIIKILPMLGKAFSMAFSGWGLIIAGAIAGVILLWKNWDKVKGFLIAIWNGIKKVASAVWNAIKTIIVGYVKAVWTITKTIWTTIANVAKTIWNGIKTAARTVWNGIKTAITTPIRAAKNTLSSLWQGIKKAATTVWGGIKSVASTVWNGIKNAILTPITAAKNAVKRIIDKIKGFFSFKWKLPKIPLPHFRITPAGWKFKDLLKGKIPKLGIDWYAKGGIFNNPSVIGVGEAGSEAVIPLNKFWKKLDAMAENNSPIVVNVYGSDNMSVNELATAVEQKIIQMQKRRTQAWA